MLRERIDEGHRLERGIAARLLTTEALGQGSPQVVAEVRTWFRVTRSVLDAAGVNPKFPSVQDVESICAPDAALEVLRQALAELKGLEQKWEAGELPSEPTVSPTTDEPSKLTGLNGPLTSIAMLGLEQAEVQAVGRLDSDRLMALEGLHAFCSATPNRVFMDNTTLFTAKELLMGSDPSYVLTPLTLLDLSTFVTNVVIHERIYHLESRTFSSSRFNELLGEEVFTSVPVRSSSSLEDAIVRVWYETTQHIQKLRYGAEARGPVAEEYRTLQQGWSRLLDQEVSTDLLFDPNEHEHWSSDEQDMLSKVVNITHHRGVDAMGLPSDRVRRIVSESNLRGDFSERVAMILGCPYSAGTTREPLLRLRYEQSGRLAPQLSIKAIEDEYRKYVRAYVTDPMPIPLFLTAVLSKTDSLNGFFSELANLRKSARAFRAHRAGMDEAAEKGNIELYTDLRQAIASKAEFWQTLLEACPIVASGAAVVAALSTTGTVPLFASTVAAAMSVLRAMSESSRKRIARRLLKPHFWFVSELSTSASGLTDLTAKVGALWTLRPAQVQHLARGLKRLATLDPSL